MLFAANARESGKSMPFQTFAGAYIAICRERPRVREIYAFPDLHSGKIGTLTLILHTEDFQMITWHEELTFDFSDPVSNEVFTENCIFFDIETTGFSPARTDLYLIGCATRRGSLLCIDQFFSENAADQKNVLSAFLDLLSGYDTILTFNGIGFDIPYLKAKCKTLHLSDPFDAHSYIDLYKEVSRFKFLFALTSYKQKSIELFLGIDRIDAYSGGELIEVYKEYVRHPAKDSLALLKQHNYEDVLYMPKLLPVLSYPKLWEQAFSLQSLQASEYRSMDGVSGNKELFFTLALQYPVPKPVSFSYDDCYLSMSGSTARLRVRLFEGELRFFYDGSPKDYYYLPAEDIAVHKSIASAVDKEHRVQANASNCYGKKYAIFLPQYDAMFSPVFREQPRGRKCYFELSADFAADPAMQMDYVLHLLETMRSHRK